MEDSFSLNMEHKVDSREDAAMGTTQESGDRETSTDIEMLEGVGFPSRIPHLVAKNQKIPEAISEEDVEDVPEDVCEDEYLSPTGSDYYSTYDRRVWWPAVVGIDKIELKSEVDIFTYTKTTKSLNSKVNLDLCRFCRVYFDTWGDVLRLGGEGKRTLSTAHHKTMRKLHESSSRGCSMCSLILSKTRHLQQPSKEDKVLDLSLKPRGVLHLLTGGYPFQQLHFEFDSGKPNAAEILFLKVLMSPLRGSDRITTKIPPQIQVADVQLGNDSNLDQNSMALIQHWIAECRKDHPACRKERQTMLPTRLIKVDGKPPRLYLTAGRNDCSTYCTLSHCWGNLEVLRLQESNLEEFLQEIPYDKLCKTFRDAITVARELGFSWLWIDSLCILQNDNEDWLRESARMSSVYGGSCLNIAATAASNGDTGCLFDRDPTYGVNRQFEIEVDGNKLVYEYADLRFVEEGLGETPLAKRAWILQERLLAPRTLHFATSQLFWECRAKYACQLFPRGIPDVFFRSPVAIPKHKLWKSWYLIVGFYSSCSLTYPSDKMAAISGIARKIQEHTGDEYIAGLWRRDIILGLCWVTSGTRTRRIRSTTNLPSWTWAAVDGRVGSGVLGDFKSIISYIELVDIKLNLANIGDLFGHVNGGTLTVKSKLMRQIPEQLKDGTHRLPLISDRTFHWDFADDREGEFLSLPLNVFQRSERDFYFFCLLIRKTGQGNGQYERAGMNCEMFSVHPYQRNMEAQNHFDRLLKSEHVRHPPKEGDYKDIQTDEDGTVSYIIDII